MKSLASRFGSIFALGLSSVFPAACVTTPPPRADASAAAQFERMKSLAGEWVCLGEQSDAPAGSLVRYHVTSGGSALLETVFADSAHEMVTVYHLDGGRLALTHYCTMANQPRMLAEPSVTPDRIVFRLAGGANVDVEHGHFMGAAEFEFIDDSRVTSKWTMFSDGKPQETVRMSMARSWR